MRTAAEDKLLKAIEQVRYASVYNFQPWLASEAKTLYTSLLWPSVLFHKLLKQGRIKPIEVYPKNKFLYRYNKFFKSTDDGTRTDELSYNMAEHQSALRDVVLAFIYLYPDYEITVDYFKLLKGKNEHGEFKLNPDAVITMTSPENKTYNFVVELERSKSPMDIIKNKIEKIDHLYPLQGLSEHTKFLIVFTYEKFNVFWRPIEYTTPEVQKVIKAVDNRFNSLISKLPPNTGNKYRFMMYHQFPDLNKAVWKLPNGNLTNLI